MIFCIYTDLGVSRQGVEEWKKRLYEMKIPYRLVYADDIKNGTLKNFSGFIIPGGADVQYCYKLNGSGNENIKKFVANGGMYIGSCAGAYYAHKSIDWQNTTEHITGERELGFFTSTATGPLIKPYNPLTSEGLAFVRTSYNGRTAHVYYKGGPIMSICDETEVISYFILNENCYPAVIRKKIGKGVAVGISPHIEFTDTFLESIHAPKCLHRSPMFLDIMEYILRI